MWRMSSIALGIVASVAMAAAQEKSPDGNRIEADRACGQDAPCLQVAAVASCQAYATSAIALFNRKNRSGCNLSGPEWHGNRADHEKWCNGVGLSRADAEIAKRERALAQCGGAGEGEKCRIYAQSAVNQYNENVRRKCAFNDSRWSRNYGNHMNWCLNVSQAQRESEMKARAAALQRCGANARYCPWCPS